MSNEVPQHSTATHEQHVLPAPEEHKLLPPPHDSQRGEEDSKEKPKRSGQTSNKDDEGEHKKSSKRPLILFCIVVLVVFLLILLFGWLPRHARNKKADEKASEERNALPVVTVTRVKRAKGGAGLVIPGTTTPLTEAYVYARANGYLTKRYVDIGDHVRKGQVLALLDAPDLDQQVDQAREQLRQAEAQKVQQQTQLALNKVTFERYNALVAKGVFSRQDGDQREADYLAQVANVASADRNIEAFRANLRRTIALQGFERVTAPFSGVITERNVDVGALISTSGSGGSSSPTPMPTGQTGTGTQAGTTNTSGSSGNASSLATLSTGGAQGGALFGIAQTQRLRILVSVPEGYADSVKPGQHTTLYFQEFPQTPFHGDVTRTAASIDQNTRTLLTEVQVDNRDGKLLSGMYAVVTFAAAGGQGPITIPGDSISIRKDRPTVGVIQNGIVHLVPITIGRDYGAETEIVGGLKEGDIIATIVTDDVLDGAKVNTVASKQDQQDNTQSPVQPRPPGGSTQYSDPGITDQDMQGQNAKPQQKSGAGGSQGGGAKKASGNKGSKP